MGFYHWVCQNCLIFFYQPCTKPTHAVIGLASVQCGPFSKEWKKTLKKSPKTPKKKVKNSFLLQRKFPLLIQKCGFIHGKTCIYTVTVVYSHLKLILSLCFLSHQRFYCRIESCSYPVNLWHRMNQSFRYICNF